MPTPPASIFRQAATRLVAVASLAGALHGCCLTAGAQSNPTAPCPEGMFTDTEYGYVATFPPGLQCEFKKPDTTGQQAFQTVRFIATDVSRGSRCLVAVSIIPKPDTGSMQGAVLQQTLDGLLTDGERRPDGSYYKQDGSKIYRTLQGGPPTISARVYTGSSCDNDLLASVLESLAAVS